MICARNDAHHMANVFSAIHTIRSQELTNASKGMAQTVRTGANCEAMSWKANPSTKEPAKKLGHRNRALRLWVEETAGAKGTQEMQESQRQRIKGTFNHFCHEFWFCCPASLLAMAARRPFAENTTAWARYPPPLDWILSKHSGKTFSYAQQKHK